MNLKILLFVITVFFFWAPVNGQRAKLNSPLKAVKDSTKWPSDLLDFRFIKTIPDSKELLEFTFAIIEQLENVHITYNLDSIHLFSNQELISLKNIQRDTACHDSSYSIFCEWKFAFLIDNKQRQFLEKKELDKVSFWYNGIADNVYLKGSDKKMFQNKLNNSIK